MENRIAMKDASEKSEVSRVIMHVSKFPKLSWLFIQHARLLKSVPLNFISIQGYKLKVASFSKYESLIWNFTIEIYLRIL